MADLGVKLRRFVIFIWCRACSLLYCHGASHEWMWSLEGQETILVLKQKTSPTSSGQSEIIHVIFPACCTLCFCLFFLFIPLVRRDTGEESMIWAFKQRQQQFPISHFYLFLNLSNRTFAERQLCESESRHQSQLPWFTQLSLITCGVSSATRSLQAAAVADERTQFKL